MKKLNTLYLLLLAVGIMVTSCNKDDGPNPAPSIEGKWVFSKAQVFDANGLPTTEEEPYVSLDGPNDETCTNNVDSMTFKPAGATPTNAVYNDYPQVGCELTEYDFTYTRSGDQLMLIGLTSNPVPFTITLLNATQMKLKLTSPNASIVITLVRG